MSPAMCGRLFRGNLMVDGRRSEHSLYRKELATYEHDDQFDHNAALGFIRLWGLSQQTQARRQLLTPTPAVALPNIMPPSH